LTARELRQIAAVRDKFASGRAREIRLAARVSLREEARAAGVSEAALWRYENAERVPRAAQALALARVLARLEQEARA